MPSVLEQLTTRLKAGATVVIIQDSDEALIRNVAQAVGAAFPGGVKTKTGADPGFMDALVALPKGSGVLIGLDVLAIMGENPIACRLIRDVALQMRNEGEQPSRLILIETPAVKIPPLIAGDVSVIIPPLPSVDDLEVELQGFLEGVKGTVENPREIAMAVAGMGRHEAVQMFARSHIEKGMLDPAWLRAEKAEAISIRSNRALTIETVGDLDLGGMDAIFEWVDQRGRAFSEKAKTYGLPTPKGALAVGVAGGGKSAMAKAIARRWKLPLLRWDIGKMFGSLVGQSENNTRMAFQIIESCSPCVVLIDEIDKGLNMGSGSGDSGTSTRVFGSILTWMQDKTCPTFVFATANDVTKLPAALLRKGRFDEMFYVGLPDIHGREAIARIHLARRSQAFGDFEEWPKKIAAVTDSWTGAEIEQAILSGMYRGFSEDRLTTLEDVLTAAKATTPISKTMRAQIQEVERWAVDNNVVMASKPPEVTLKKPGNFRTTVMLDGSL